MRPIKKPYPSFSEYLKTVFGEKVRKIPLDAGFSCPNRDGTLSSGGCVFCGQTGSGSGLADKGLGLKEQWEHWSAVFRKKYKASLFLAYLQSYSNTYGPIEKLRAVLGEIESFPNLAGVCLGTRPDCLDKEKIRLISSLSFREVWLDMGLQSSNDRTLRRINRSHDAKCFGEAVLLAADSGIKVCAHVIFGLPGETMQDCLETVRFLNALPIKGIKFHNLFVARDSALAGIYLRGAYTPMERDEYIEAVVQSVALLRSDIIIHRLNADPTKEELLAPQWAGRKRPLVEELERRITTLNLNPDY